MLRLRRNPTIRLAHSAHEATRPLFRVIKRLLTILLIISILVGGGFAVFLWYMDKNSTTPKQAAMVEEVETTATPKPKVNQFKQIGVAIQYITPNVAPGGSMTYTVHTNAEAICTLEVIYDTSETEMKFDDSNLESKTADENGVASWKWTVPPTAPQGKAEADASCANKKTWAHVVGDFVVK